MNRIRGWCKRREPQLQHRVVLIRYRIHIMSGGGRIGENRKPKIKKIMTIFKINSSNSPIGETKSKVQQKKKEYYSLVMEERGKNKIRLGQKKSRGANKGKTLKS